MAISKKVTQSTIMAQGCLKRAQSKIDHDVSYKNEMVAVTSKTWVHAYVGLEKEFNGIYIYFFKNLIAMSGNGGFFHSGSSLAKIMCFSSMCVY